MTKLEPLNSAAAAFLSRVEHGLLIDGRETPALSGQSIDSFDPSTGQVLTRLAAGGPEDVDRAVAAARAAFEGSWSRWTPYQRQLLLIRAHDHLSAHYEELAQIESADMGAPISRTRAMKNAVLQMILFFASQAVNVTGETMQNSLAGNVTTLTLKSPVGVVGGIIPWNGPLISQWWILGAALAAGCTVVMKPAEDASLSVLRVVQMLHEIGLPDGVVNVVTGTGAVAGARLAAHPDVDRVAFTGSTATGRRIIEASAVNMKRLQLELGGKSPDIILADADLDKAVPGAAMGVFTNSGQVCFAGSRVFVHRSIVQEVTERLAAHAAGIAVGHAFDSTSQLGPLVSRAQLERVMHYIGIAPAEGAQLAGGGNRPEGSPAGGYYVRPTVFGNVHNDMTIAREEIFGPVISVIPFDTVEEAIQLGNRTEYGLGGAVWSRNIDSALQVVKSIRTGTMWVNCYGLIDPMVGFGGVKNSGYGIKGSRAHVEAYLATKSVYISS
ncbi:MAG: aldehyde dehydrogenase [Rhodobacteraceae bacterium]|jgi:aldehyde dehydrogenase (NAD+)|nr:aldehyde dehydrogenase [Paracoccaceae bacterium]